MLNRAGNVPNAPEIISSYSESPASYETLKPTDEPEPTSKTYTYEVRAHIHKSLPEYRFVATGKMTGIVISKGDWAPAFVTGLNVYDDNGLLILSEDFTDILQMPYWRLITTWNHGS
jgi:hypothetical protein